VKQFGLMLDPFFPATGNRVTCIAGRRLVGKAGPLDLAQVPLPFAAEELKLGYVGCLMKYLFAHLPELGDATSPVWPQGDVSRFEVSIAEFCRRQGASAAFVQTVALGHDLDGMSALQFLRDAALGARTKVWFKIRGGNDLLPKALADALAARILYEAPVKRIEQNGTRVRAVYERPEGQGTVDGDYLVCTLPAGVLGRVEVTPAMPPAKRDAIARVGGLPMARVFLQTRHRFWLERGDSGWGATDDPIDVWDYSRDQRGTRGILGAYTSGRMARRVTGLRPAERGSFVLDLMERVHPGSREHFETSASHSWITDPWALGAGAEFGPGRLSASYRHLRTPEGRIHFAGEHTSPWSGWMNGGLESGNRAAAEIQAR
jgi:monoamine oxidase